APTTEAHVYSRHTAPNTTRLEAILTSIIHAPCLTYSSGLAALHAIYVCLKPRRVSIGEGYHGSHGVLAIQQKLCGTALLPLDCPASDLEAGDVIHLETPLNPTGEAYDITQYAEKAHSRGAILIVDATFGPPGLQDPFQWGADVVMHSGTKYLGGHSDMLCGVLATNNQDILAVLKEERVFLGSVMGSMEGWLGVRSLRTLDLRVKKQSANATKIVQWLNNCKKADGKERDAELVQTVVHKIQHASLQHEDMAWLKRQMPNGFGPVFAIWFKEERMARRLPSLLTLFHHATSLGGVESLIEWRSMSDRTVDRRLVRAPLVPIEQGREDAYATWPPIVTFIEKLGYVQSPSQPFYSRDIGRSFALDGRIYMVFGDTFCNDAGVSSNTYQVIPNLDTPTESHYLTMAPDGLVSPLIEENHDDRDYLAQRVNADKRVGFWCFGGIVETNPGLGWVWYQRHIINPDRSTQLTGTGIARISHDKSKPNGELSSTRMPGMMFEPGEPQFGSFSTLLVNDFVYVWGQKDTDIFLARVPKDSCQQRHTYEFWNGREFVPQIDRIVPVLQDMQQGQFFRSKLFGPQLPWVFIGVTRWADNLLIIGAAPTLEGPWAPLPLFKAEGMRERNAYLYCMYAHPWATQHEEGKLCVSWCDPWPGGVIAAKLQFQMEAAIYWGEIGLEGHSSTIYSSARWADILLIRVLEYVLASTMSEAREVTTMSSVRYKQLGSPHRLRLQGPYQEAVEARLYRLQRHIEKVVKEEEAARRAAEKERTLMERIAACFCCQ
ncbi:MAG: hypothetical protein Q9222_007006, partial [Ikaeria aurantiellina]